MSELNGTLDGVGLPPIVRFLGGIKKSGTLRLTHHEWYGEIFFAEGQVTGARFGSQTGLAALDALVEALPDADFQFDSQAINTGEPTIRLGQDPLYVHLDEIARRLDAGQRRFPSVDQVPSLVAQDETTDEGEEPLPLDRGTLQTLLSVDGKRSVRDIVAQRGTLDALWQLASLVEVGLIELRQGDPVEFEPDAPMSDFEPGVVTEADAEAAPEPAMRPAEPVPQPVPPAFVPRLPAEPSAFVPPLLPAEPPEELVARCPKLGFDDDPTNSFSRPTRLHRCYATGKSMPLSLDQQRELCLSGQFATCPRLNAAQPDDDPRIVRLPIATRAPAIDREPTVLHEPTRLRAANGTQEDSTGEPTPLRARLERAAAAGAAVGTVGDGAVAEPPAAPEVETLRPPRVGTADRAVPVSAATSPPAERRFIGIPAAAIAGVVVVLAVIATVAYLLLPQMDSLFVDDSIDTSSLPNSSRVVAGTPVSVITGKANATAAANAGGAAAAAQPQATPEAAPTEVPLQPTAAPMLLEEHFKNNDAGWPSSSLGPATVSNGSYRLATRLAGQFVAIGAPLVNPPADVSVSAGFRKLAGPAGGGYGIILRDQGPGPRDGASQEGRYYVLEIGDKGEIGIWRRDADHWADLLSWQHSDVVKPGTAPNELSVKAVGSTLSMTVNGTEVATRTDSALTGGQVGLFVGGDGNQVLVDHFLVQAP